MAGELVLVIDDSPTITKVVQLVLTKAGYQVRDGGRRRARLAARRAQRPDLILLDFVMPRDERLPVLPRAAPTPKLRDIPVVLMSAKGDQVGERFVKVMGIVDYITKPFSPEAITAVVQHTIGKYGQPGTRTTTRRSSPARISPRPTTPIARHARAARSAAARPLTDVVSARVAALFQLAERCAEPARGRDRRRRDRDATRALDDARSAAARRVDLGLFGEGVPGLRGDLRVVPLAEVLQLLDVQEQSGVLTVERCGARVDIYFRRGRVDQAIAEGVARRVPARPLRHRRRADVARGLRAFLESRSRRAAPAS